MGLRFLSVILGLGAATKLRFGTNECENGPSFWCQSITTSNQCSATKYCANNDVSILIESCNLTPTESIGLQLDPTSGLSWKTIYMVKKFKVIQLGAITGSKKYLFR